MRIRAFFVSALLFCGISVAVLYGKDFIQPVNKKNMITEINQTKDTSILIKELIARMKSELEVDWDRFPALVTEVETQAVSTGDPASTAVLHSMLAEMYSMYFEQNRWLISRRTAIAGYTPEDIREWPENLFVEKIQEELRLSLQPAEVLQQMPVSYFQSIMESSKEEELFKPSLYDFLMKRAIDMRPSEAFYTAWSTYRNSLPDPRASLWVELKALEYQYLYGRNNEARANYEHALDSLMQKYEKADYSVEIILAKVDALNAAYSAEKADSIQALQYGLLKEGVERFPRYERIGLLTNRLASMEEPTLSTSTKNTVYPGKNLSIQLNYKNISQVTVRIYKSLRTPLEVTPYRNTSPKEKGALLKELTFSLHPENTYKQQDSMLCIPMGQPGLYECVVTAPGQEIENIHTISVSRIASAHRNTPTGEAHVYVTDFESGKPISGATVTYYGGQRRELKPLGIVKTDKNGLAVLPKNTKIAAYQATLSEDNQGRLTSLYTWGRTDEPTKDRVALSLITDRGLYRPGQTILFKGIAYIADMDNPRVVAGKSFTVSLRDANNKEVSQQTFTTNAFGSFHGEFILPRQVLTGGFTLTTGESSAYVQVEEYKRPTFSVEILPVKEEVAFGDSVTIQGKIQTFSGASLQEGEVTWRIIRRPLWPRGSSYQAEQVAAGVLSLDKEGGFSIRFLPEKSKNELPWNVYDRFEVSATVTDSKGETQESYSLFSIGETSLVLSCDLPDQVDKDSAEVMILARTLNGEASKTNGTYRIVCLEEEKEANRLSVYKEAKVVVNGTFTSGQAISRNVLNQLPSGRYRIVAEAKDNKGRVAKDQQDFVLYSYRDKRPPVYAHTWLLADKNATFLPGEEAEIIFGTSDKEAYVFYELYANGRYHQQQVVKVSNENKTWKIPFKEEYGDGAIASFSFVKEGELHTIQTRIYRKRADWKLTIRPETFRDHLLPGNKETWKFRVLKADSLPAPAEVLAGLYDASLDKILPFNWYFSPIRSVSLWAPVFAAGESFNQNSQYANAGASMVEVKEYGFSRLDWQGITDGRNLYYMSDLGGSIRTRMYKSSAPSYSEDVVVEEAATGGGELRQQSPEIAAEDQGAGVPHTAASPQLRKNFNETAFFYPTLRTNEAGDVLISFTMPETNTTWKFQSIAHTADLKFGTYTNEIVTSKPLMVLPNLPRFIRQGDQVSLSAQVINQSDKAIAGRVRLELFDPATDQAIICLTKAERTFALEANTNTTASWNITVPAGLDLAGIRIVADSEESSDGEQYLIPVLSNQILITESTPFYLMNEGKKQFRINEGKNTRSPFRLTLELSGNPVWYAVQALPTITQPENDNILSWFAAYYGNMVAASMIQQHPRLSQVIRQWVAQGENASTLLSNLEKNEELKSILLEETPWVLDAQSETEQKQRLTLLFDINRASDQRDRALEQLIKQQKEDGGWGWFNGFSSDRNMTLSVLEGMKQLVYLNITGFEQNEKEMQIKALRFLDEMIRKDYESLKKHTKQWEKILPSSEQIRYIYVRSSYRDIPESQGTREAIRFYTDQAEKNWSKFSLHEKAQLMLLMRRNGKNDVAADIFAWLRKTATTSQENGMYWANNRRGANYLISPVETHSLLIFAFKESGASQTELDRMKQWLLNQKRTQYWESTPATLNAIYAILFTGGDWLNENNTVSVQWGDRTYNTTEGETATGYLKLTASQPEITSQHHMVTIDKQGKSPVWGSIYNQYFEALDKASGQKGVLSVEKRLFVEINTGTERQIRPVTPMQPLRVGDKVIVRLTIRTDRAMEYVHLKDLRAGCFEPARQLSGITYQGGLSFYSSPKDISENFFFSRLPKGTFVLEYPVYVSRTGEYSGGISTIQCMYAPEFVSHTEGDKLIVKE